MIKILITALQGENMDENDYQKMIKENMRTSDMLFLEYAVKKCALTLSKEEILSHTEHILTEYTEQQVNEILLEYRSKKMLHRRLILAYRWRRFLRVTQPSYQL